MDKIDFYHTDPYPGYYFSTDINVPVEGTPPVSPIETLITYKDGKYVDEETPTNNVSKAESPNHYVVGKYICDPCSDGNSCSNCGELNWRWVYQTVKGVGDPIYLNNLEFIAESVDLTIHGRGINFDLKRTYRSRISFNGPMGRNWDFNHNRRFVPDPTDSSLVILYNGYARGDAYSIVSESQITSPGHHFRKVVKEADGSLLLREGNGTIYKFYALGQSARAGKQSAVITRCGNRLTYEYNDAGQLVKILDSLSRPIEFVYNSQGRIEKVRDFIGREVSYSYDEEGNLVSVTSPSVTVTPHGNDFNNGQTIAYTYSKGFSDNSLNHNLLTITAPNEVASQGPARVINHYDSDDRLISQTWGGTNASGVAAGGSISYTHETMNDGVEPNNADIARVKVTTNDRNGNEKRFFYNNAHLLIRKEEKTKGIRPGDPTAFVTEYRYTATSLMKEILYPEGNRTVYQYDESNPDPFQRGNLLSVTQYPVQPEAEISSITRFPTNTNPFITRFGK